MHCLRLLWAAHNEEVWLRRYRRNVCRRNLETIAEMPDVLFIERFRLNKVTFKMLCNDLRVHTSLRGTRVIPLEVKVNKFNYNFETKLWDKYIVGLQNYF